MEVTITRKDFAKSSGYRHGYNNSLFCPLQTTLMEGGQVVKRVGERSLTLMKEGKDADYRIPFDDIWGGEGAMYSQSDINRFSKWAKNPFLKYLVPNKIKFEVTLF